jgi:hypothetical protein
MGDRLTDLKTAAENRADKARGLPNFSGLSLPAVREQIIQLLSLIGREGIFSTYTMHDIRHIDAMLKMLDWIVPQSTQSAMTSVDWLLVVLAIYLHDLGMLVTTEEYLGRLDNPEYRSWFDSLALTTDGREYLARTDRMTPDQKDKFFFQEFVRKGHAQRIREWITGRHSRRWGNAIQSAAKAIADTLQPLPVRFRDYLGTVCESHHKADLDKTAAYPLVERFGNEPDETANVQYAAILLRTADVLHVTKDRTPSVMFQLIRFSDPQSVSEWDKQLGASSVGPKSRKLIESDPQTAVIQINADFTEERPLFALQEYVAYADAEIKQSKRWIEESQESPDGKGYSYPWHEVSGDIRLEGVPPQPLRFELNRGRLLDLLVGHTIYNDPTVAVRELLQNAIDAVRFQSYLRRKTGEGEGVPESGRVQVRWNPDDRVLVVEDNGIGMDRDVIKHHLMSVGSSYYNTPQFEVENRDFAAISRFGIGILTSFMVSDDIEIITFRNGKGHRIRMTSVQSTYLLRELEAGDRLLAGLEPHGTRVTIRLRATVDLSKRSLEEIVRYWIILPECLVLFMEGNKAPTPIGFHSPAQALECYYSSAAALQPKRYLESQTEILSTRRKSVERSGDADLTASYELAFAVNAATSYIPERSFATLPDETCPAVCIEGIRVSNVLPGFESPARLGALLSVRGSRRFRTTVSRDDLEVDEEYDNVARLLAELLFEHVGGEVTRIAGRAGRPLSLASTAARWLFGALENRAGRRNTVPYLAALFRRQPSIVVEQVEATAERPRTTRRLMSADDLRSLPSFWTVDSRCVESLGTISRDLGRELSLNDFLVALAPDITQLRYSPILPDAQEWTDALRISFRPEKVEFSREHQQSAVQWDRLGADSGAAGFNVPSLLSTELLNLVYHRVLGRQPREDKLKFDVDSADVAGDDVNVKAVVSRVGTMLQRGSVFEQMWNSITTRIRQLASEGQDVEGLVLLVRTANSFLRYLTYLARTGFSEEALHRRRLGYYGDNEGPETPEELTRLIEDCNLSGQMPHDWPHAFKRGAVFEARGSWRSWGAAGPD